jgi:hypothetical protein
VQILTDFEDLQMRRTGLRISDGRTRERAREGDRPLQPLDGPALRAETESGWQSASPMARPRSRHR